MYENIEKSVRQILLVLKLTEYYEISSFLNYDMVHIIHVEKGYASFETYKTKVIFCKFINFLLFLSLFVSLTYLVRFFFIVNASMRFNGLDGIAWI